MPSLTLAAIIPDLQTYVADLRYQQITDQADPNFGALVNPIYGMADPKQSEAFIVGCAYLALAARQIEPDLFAQAIRAAEYLLKAQRPSGLIDLLSVNYDSSPDTGFTVQNLCAVIELARPQAQADAAWQSLLDKLEQFVRRAVPGMLTGGFHTPNHRWVIVSALVQAKALFPDLEVRSTVEAYLAEGIDIDEEGAFIERSVGVYDAVNDRSLLFIAQYWDCPEALAAVERNLNFDLHLLHADGTAETGLSRRQDYGTRTVPLALASCYIISNHLQPNPLFVCAAQMLWEKQSGPGGHVTWLAYALLKCGELPPVSATLPEAFSRHYAHNGIWRVRRGLLNASFFQDTTRLLTLTYGQAELSSLKISQTYFGQFIGRFVSNALTVAGDTGTLRSEGLANPRRPAYELPLGRPVPPDKWHDMIQERDLRRLPPATSTLTATEVEGGFDLRYQTLDGLAGVAAQIAFDFPPGGIWETDDIRTQPEAGQVIFLKQGTGSMRYGNDVIEIGPGAHAHGMWAMREAEPAPAHVRILLTFLTPVDFSFALKSYRGLKSDTA